MSESTLPLLIVYRITTCCLTPFFFLCLLGLFFFSFCGVFCFSASVCIHLCHCHAWKFTGCVKRNIVFTSFLPSFLHFVSPYFVPFPGAHFVRSLFPLSFCCTTLMCLVGFSCLTSCCLVFYPLVCWQNFSVLLRSCLQQTAFYFYFSPNPPGLCWAACKHADTPLSLAVLSLAALFQLRLLRRLFYGFLALALAWLLTQPSRRWWRHFFLEQDWEKFRWVSGPRLLQTLVPVFSLT